MESVHSKISGIASSRTRGWQQSFRSVRYIRRHALFAARVRGSGGELPYSERGCGNRHFAPLSPAKYPCGRGNSAISDA